MMHIDGASCHLQLVKALYSRLNGFYLIAYLYRANYNTAYHHNKLLRKPVNYSRKTKFTFQLV